MNGPLRGAFCEEGSPLAKRYDVACAGLQVVDVLVEGVDAGLFQRESTRPVGILALGGDA